MGNILRKHLFFASSAFFAAFFAALLMSLLFLPRASYAESELIVNNHPPVASFSTSKTHYYYESHHWRINLYNYSTDEDDDILSYKWYKKKTGEVDWQEFSTSKNTNFDLTLTESSEVYHVKLVVYDGISSDEIVHDVTVYNDTPYFYFYINQSTPESGVKNIDLTARAYRSSDYDRPLTYTWYKKEGNSGEWVKFRTTHITESSNDGSYVVDTASVQFDTNHMQQHSQTIYFKAVLSDGIDSYERTTSYTFYENRAPYARAEYSVTTDIDTNMRLIDFLNTSSDLDGDPLTYRWYIRYPNQTEFQQFSTETNPTFSISRESEEVTYRIRLVASDGMAEGDTEFDIGILPNNPPVASFDYEDNYNGSHKWTIDFINDSLDSDSDPLTYAWYIKKRGEPDTAYELFSTSEEPSYSFTQAEAPYEHYDVKLVVNDPWSSSSYNGSFYVYASDPYVHFYWSSLRNGSQGEISIYHNCSHAYPSGDPITYEWSYKKQEEPNSEYKFFSSERYPTLNLELDRPTAYNIRLIVDDGLQSDSYTSSVTFSNQAPTADFSYTVTASGKERLISLTNNSVSPDEDVLSFEWYTQKEGENTWTFFSSQANPILEKTISEPGETYLVKLVASDWASSSEFVQEVRLIDNEPIANFSWNLDAETKQLSFENTSRELDNDLLNFEWYKRIYGTETWEKFSTEEAPVLSIEDEGEFAIEVRMIADDGVLTDDVIKSIVLGDECPVVLNPTPDTDAVLIGEDYYAFAGNTLTVSYNIQPEIQSIQKAIAPAIVLVFDTSASMGMSFTEEGNRMAKAKEATKIFMKNLATKAQELGLKDDIKVGLVSTNLDAGTVIPMSNILDASGNTVLLFDGDNQIIDFNEAIDTLEYQYSTNLEAGIRVANEMLESQELNGYDKRMILISDGESNISPAAHDEENPGFAFELYYNRPYSSYIYSQYHYTNIDTDRPRYFSNDLFITDFDANYTSGDYLISYYPYTGLRKYIKRPDNVVLGYVEQTIADNKYTIIQKKTGWSDDIRIKTTNILEDGKFSYNSYNQELIFSPCIQRAVDAAITGVRIEAINIGSPDPENWGHKFFEAVTQAPEEIGNHYTIPNDISDEELAEKMADVFEQLLSSLGALAKNIEIQDVLSEGLTSTDETWTLNHQDGKTIVSSVVGDMSVSVGGDETQAQTKTLNILLNEPGDYTIGDSGVSIDGVSSGVRYSYLDSNMEEVVEYEPFASSTKIKVLESFNITTAQIDSSGNIITSPRDYREEDTVYTKLTISPPSTTDFARFDGSITLQPSQEVDIYGVNVTSAEFVNPDGTTESLPLAQCSVTVTPAENHGVQIGFEVDNPDTRSINFYYNYSVKKYPDSSLASGDVEISNSVEIMGTTTLSSSLADTRLSSFNAIYKMTTPTIVELTDRITAANRWDDISDDNNKYFPGDEVIFKLVIDQDSSESEDDMKYANIKVEIDFDSTDNNLIEVENAHIIKIHHEDSENSLQVNNFSFNNEVLSFDITPQDKGKILIFPEIDFRKTNSNASLGSGNDKLIISVKVTGIEDDASEQSAESNTSHNADNLEILIRDAVPILM